MPTAGDRPHASTDPTTHERGRPQRNSELQNHFWIRPREQGDQIREAALQLKARRGTPPHVAVEPAAARRPGFHPARGTPAKTAPAYPNLCSAAVEEKRRGHAADLQRRDRRIDGYSGPHAQIGPSQAQIGPERPSSSRHRTHGARRQLGPQRCPRSHHGRQHRRRRASAFRLGLVQKRLKLSCPRETVVEISFREVAV